MKYRGMVLKILVAALVITVAAGLAAAVNDTSSDPLVSLSYLTGTYRDNLLADVDTAVAAQGHADRGLFRAGVGRDRGPGRPAGPGGGE